MRNTHFGDGNFGFQGKMKGDLSLDSDRKASRKRGNQQKESEINLNNSSYLSKDEIGFRES